MASLKEIAGVLMGVYRSLFCEMSCERCAARYRAEVQFETGDDRQQEYQEGQTVPPDDGLAPGDSFHGVAERFCPACERLWDGAHQDAMFEALAGYVAQGRMTMRDDSGTPITAEALRDRGRKTAEAILAGPAGDRRHGLVLHPFTWDGEATDAAKLAFTETFHGDVTAALESAGWPLGRDSLRALQVHIGPDMTISAQTEDHANG